MPKIVAMIPARLGSQRVPKKNLRLINGKPLIWYAIDNCKKSGVFDEIYVNSEAEVFAEIAESEGVKFYKRPAEFSTNSATNDGFGLNFMESVPCDIVIQVNPTSPFISPDDIRSFVKEMVDQGYETLHSVKNEQIEGLFDGKPLNFDPMKSMPPSQDLVPVQVFSSGIMGFSCNRFKSNMVELGCAVYGGAGKTGYYALKGHATIDIDNEEDFQLAEIVAKAKMQNFTPAYYQPKKSSSEHDVNSILKKDGVAELDLQNFNKLQVNLDEIRAGFKTPSWCKRVVNTAGYSATFISQLPGEGNRKHLHPDRDEWWIVFDGQIEWRLDNDEVVKAKKSDVVFVPKGVAHEIRVVGTEPAIRLAISIDEMEHVFV